jgi:hypothetical protein
MTLELLHFSFPIKRFTFVDGQPIQAICWNGKKHLIKRFGKIPGGQIESLEVEDYDSELNVFKCKDLIVGAELEIIKE